MKEKLIDAYMKTAETFAELSHARRLHVGAIVVKDDRIISIGYNGMPAGWDNNCENTVFVLGKEVIDTDMVSLGYTKTDNGNWTTLKSKPEVLHAETNCIAKLAKSTESGSNATMFITHSPCLDCAKLIFQSGITSVFYRESYRSEDGIQFLTKSGVTVTQVKKDS
jgi:dCMP deaminase